jgi:hypothetical protein
MSSEVGRRNVEGGMGKAECGSGNEEVGMGKAECGMRNGEGGMRNADLMEKRMGHGASCYGLTRLSRI